MPYFGGAGGDEGVKFRLGTSISFTGNFLADYQFVIAPPDNLQNSNTQFGAVWGSWIETFSYNENNVANGLTTLTFNDLVGVKGIVIPNALAGLTALSFPNLTFIGGDFTPTSMAALTTLSVPKLTEVVGTLNPAILSSLTTLDLSALKHVGGNFSPTSLAALTTLTLTNLLTIGGSFSCSSCASLATISAPALKNASLTFTSNFNLSATGAGLTTINFPALINVGTGMDAHTGNGNIATVTLGAAGMTKLINGNVNFSGQKLNQASVDQILHTIASLDGTGGTTSWGAGKTLTLNGGTNSTPSATGLTDKATIVARGGTVLNN